jgi:peptidoglycan/xylan/chitin deacetylase (PgdA/CDA1 family)
MMKLSRTILMIALCVVSAAVFAAGGPWNGKSAAVVLSYDDALNVHLDEVIPALDERGMHGTFYLTLSSEAFRTRMHDWQAAAAEGHELGNHTLFHPCRSGFPDRGWVTPDYDLDNYSLRRMVDEVVLTNAVLEQLDGRKSRSFAYTCGDTTAGNESFIDAIKPYFSAARGVADTYSSPQDIDLYNVNTYAAYNDTGQRLVALASQAINDKKLIVYLFHGVGGDHDINVSTEAHTELLDYLQEHRQDIWIATMDDVARFLAK